MRTKFSNEQIEKLKLNPCVFNCTNNSINYTFEFKKRALELNDIGISAKEIWSRSNFDTSWWRKGYFKETIRDWKKIVDKKGVEGLMNCTPFSRHGQKTTKKFLKDDFGIVLESSFLNSIDNVHCYNN